MTMILTSPALYVCDGCGLEVEGTTARLPKGWREWFRQSPVEKHDYVGHACPPCAAPEAKP